MTEELGTVDPQDLPLINHRIDAKMAAVGTDSDGNILFAPNKARRHKASGKSEDRFHPDNAHCVCGHIQRFHVHSKDECNETSDGHHCQCQQFRARSKQKKDEEYPYRTTIKEIVNADTKGIVKKIHEITKPNVEEVAEMENGGEGHRKLAKLDRQKFTDGQLKELIEKGWHGTQIARELGVKRYSIVQRAKRMGLILPIAKRGGSRKGKVWKRGYIPKAQPRASTPEPAIADGREITFTIPEDPRILELEKRIEELESWKKKVTS